MISSGTAYDGKKADVWSAGVMLFKMIFAKYPFELAEDATLNLAERGQRMMRRIAAVRYSAGARPRMLGWGWEFRFARASINKGGGITRQFKTEHSHQEELIVAS